MAAFDLRNLGQMNMGMGAFAPVQPEPIDPQSAAAQQGIDIASLLAPPPTAQPNFLQKVGAVLADTASGLRGDLGAQGHPSAAGTLAAKTVSPTGINTQQLGALGKALFPDDPKAQFLMATGNKDFLTALADQYKFHSVNGGDVIVGPNGMLTQTDKLVGDNGVYGTQSADGYTQTGQRSASIAEGETGRHNLTTEGLTASGQAETGRHNQIEEAVAKGRLGVDQAGVGLRRQELDLSRSQRGLAPGYEWNADHTAQHFIPGSAADPAVKTTAGLKPVPAKIAQGVAENTAALKQIDDAIAAIQGNKGAMGLKNVAGDTIMQRVDPKGVDVRAQVANIGSKIIHDRSGAAVTAAETPRLKPFIPSALDSPDAAVTKLQALRRQVESNNNEIEVAYGEDSGYRPLSRGDEPRAAQPAPKASGGPPDAAVAKLKADPRLRVYFDQKYGPGSAKRVLGK